ncbi:MAG: replication factor C small subunit [Candidatus Freyarchaeota archaeon]|nr:replication factor C small subunit [Candidatus Jordarchaeia archaeon]MBS7269470.1 replication factor C small subunit [Candidatus Jordarchaeia archaeon]MBS7278761.1 replication factor C small subunit [Candidatus Jordarchaeia archaeon]
MLSEEIQMWTEKYRPKTLKEIVNQKEIVSRLEGFVAQRDLPHCLFAGPPGTGKTTAALCLAHDLFREYFQGNFLELNASDARGIDVIRTTVKDFARTMSLGDIPFKILVLDEADALTSEAQQALRRTMERYTRTCRFILIVNYSSKIIEPIQSRCALFRFSRLSREDIIGMLKFISEKEGVELKDDGVEAVLYVSEGDLRKAINTLQAASALGVAVDADSVYKVTGKARPEEVRQMLELALSGDFVQARKKLHELLINYGLSGIDVVRQVHRETFNINIPEIWKVRIADIVGEIDFRMSEGAHEEIQLSALLAQFSLVGQELGKTQGK